MFEKWMRMVDYWLGLLADTTSSDLPDQAWYDWFEDGLSPKAAAKYALEESC